MGVSEAIQCLDRILDANASEEYQDQPLAQDWARIAKIIEEGGEAVEVFIRMTGQNPRKPRSGTPDTLRSELLDTAATAILAVQHFFKDEDVWAMLEDHMIYLHGRLCDA